jgi:endonuclease YncB( thermonuclease family)
LPLSVKSFNNQAIHAAPILRKIVNEKHQRRTMTLNKSLFKKHLCVIFIIAIILSAASAYAATIRTVTGTVTKVSDGDTIHVKTPEQTKLKVRLYGVDAPETPKINQRTGRVNKPGQPYGEESCKALKSKIMGMQIRLDIIDIDKYKRMVGIVWIDDRNINLEMVRKGYAEAYVEYLKEPYRSQFMRAELEARSAKRGIWSLPDYERPKDFRKRLKVRGN